MTNNKRSSIGALALMACLTGLSFSSSAALVNRGGGMIYDTVLDVTWMQDANYMATSGFDSDGRGTFAQVNAWANSVIFGGFDDWRLPTVDPVNGGTFDISFTFNGTTDRGFNNGSTQSEMGYMFYHNLGNISFFSTDGTGAQAGSESFNNSFVDGLTGEIFSFDNIELSYWATPANIPFQNTAWGFNFRNFTNLATGEQQIHGINSALSGWLVRDGDVGPQNVNNNPDPNAIGEPGSLAILSLGLFGALYRRKMS